MVTCSQCGTSFDVSLALVATGEVRVAHCRVCPVDRVYAVCEKCDNLNRVENNPCPRCGATMWEVNKMVPQGW